MIPEEGCSVVIHALQIQSLYSILGGLKRKLIINNQWGENRGYFKLKGNLPELLVISGRNIK